MDRKARYLGCLLGLASGDAVGTTLEFKRPGSFEPITDMVGGGPFSLKPGQWTDDTSMAICLAESLLHCKGFSANDQLGRYLRWFRDGYNSSTGECFDIGGSTKQALRRFEETGEDFPGDPDVNGAGNGPLMRLAPVPMFYARVPDDARKFSRMSARTTHGGVQAADACEVFSDLLIDALDGKSLEEILSPKSKTLTKYSAGPESESLHPEVQTICAGSFREKSPPEINGDGYIVTTLEAALWAVYNHENFEDTILAAANLGNDADTVAAIAGQIAGAIYGINGIPEGWVSKLCRLEDLKDLAESLYWASRVSE